MPMKADKPRRVSDDEVRETILKQARAAGLQGKVRPEDVAMALLPRHWQTLTGRIRLLSRQLAHAGQLTILRKGKVADPDDFRGVYRLRITKVGLNEEEE
jgi:hypothetical protein